MVDISRQFGRNIPAIGNNAQLQPPENNKNNPQATFQSDIPETTSNYSFTSSENSVKHTINSQNPFEENISRGNYVASNISAANPNINPVKPQLKNSKQDYQSTPFNILSMFRPGEFLNNLYTEDNNNIINPKPKFSILS